MLSSSLRRFSSFRKFSSASQSRFLSTLVLGEYTSTGSSASLADATLSGIAGAQQLGADNKISLLLTSDNDETLSSLTSEARRVSGVSNVLCYKNGALARSLAEFVSDAVVDAQSKHSFTHVVAGISSFSRDVVPRVAGILDTSQISDVTAILSESTFERPLYAGNAIAKVESKKSSGPILLTLRLTSFQADRSALVSDSENDAVTVVQEDFDAFGTYGEKSHIADEMAKSEGPSLQSASIVVSGGRGMQNGENFAMLYELSKKFGDCAVGASRAAVDAGFVGNDLQVGQTGKVVAPNLYVAVGISGAIQHVAGMKDSKVIVAINKDEEAPIFAIADYGLKADLFEAIPELNKKMG